MRNYFNQMIGVISSIGKMPEGYHYWCMEDYVLDKGREGIVRPLTFQEQKIVTRAKKDRLFPVGFCFHNAQQLVMGDRSKKLVYVEGYASGIFPVLHAWAELDGVVVDVTWEGIPDSVPRKYFGVAFDRQRVKERRKDKVSLSFLDDWPRKYPLLKEARKLP